MTKAILSVLVLAVLAATCWASLNPKRVHLIDYNPTLNNFMFRCNELKTDDGKFPYDLLKEYMNDVSLTILKRPLPSDIFLVDMCLLNSITDGADIKLEKEYFAAHPDQGQFMNWPIVGNLENPHKISESLLKELAVTLGEWQLDKLAHRVPALNAMLNYNFTRPAAIVVHCEAGVDRTGEVSGSYYMEFLKWTYTQALTFDYSVAPRAIEPPSEHALDFYCWYLHYTKGFPNDCTFQPNSTTIATK